MTGVAQRDGAVRLDVCDEAGGEPAVGSADEAAVEAFQNLCRALREFSESAERADDERNGHCGFEPLATDVTEHNEGAAVAYGDDLEEIAADLSKKSRYLGIVPIVLKPAPMPLMTP